MWLTGPNGQYKVIYFPLGRHTVKEMNLSGYLVYVSSIVTCVAPEENDGDSNKWNPVVPTAGMRSTCEDALKRHFSNK